MRWALAPLALALAVAPGTPAAAQPSVVPWMVNPEEIVPASVDKPVFLFFTGPDRNSRRMITWTLANPAVAEELNAVTPVWIDVGRRPELAHRYEVTGTPTVVLLGRDGAVLGQHEGLLEREPFLAWLRSSAALAPLSPEPAIAPPPGESAPPESIDTTLDLAAAPPAPPAREDSVRGTAIEIRLRAPQRAAANQDIPLQVFIPGGAARVTLHHRAPAEAAYHDIAMSPNTPTIFYAVIPGDAVTAQGVEFYISASRSGQTVTEPPEGPGAPHRIAVQ